MLKYRCLLKRGAISTVALCFAVGVFIGSGIRYSFVTGVQHIGSTCVPAVGITRSEMLQRFDDIKLYVLLEYDRNLKSDIARWYYQIGDSDVYYTFKYSYKSGLVESWKMERDNGFYNWDFTDYLRPADIKKEPDL